MQAKQLNELRSENAMLSKEIEELKCRKEANFTEEYLQKEENQSILKFYTGIIIVISCAFCQMSTS